jgi:hypothetical protein
MWAIDAERCPLFVWRGQHDELQNAARGYFDVPNSEKPVFWVAANSMRAKYALSSINNNHI